MQYLLHDLIKLPLSERLMIIEKVISSVRFHEAELELNNYKTITNWQSFQVENAVESNN